MLVVMLARGYRPDAPNFVLDELRRGLAAAGARLIVDGAWSDSYARAGLIIGFEPFEDRKQLLGARVLGQRTLNRFQRMEIAATTEALVAEFGSPRNDDELSALTRDWGPFCVLKYDWSLRRNGVFAWPLGDTRPAFPSDFTPGCDLFMKFVDGDPKTYKVDAFCGTVLAGWILPTRSMREPDWQVIDVPEMLEFDVPPDARACVEAVSEALIAQGVGYASYDLMRGPDGFHLIEANTCAVSTAMWDVSPERYAANYLRAMLRALERIDRVPVWGSLRGTAYRAGHVQAAVPLPEKAAGAADAVTRAPPVGTPPAPASIEQRFFASLTKTERAPPDSLTRHVQTSLQALLHHAHRHSPFQRERLGFLFQWDGSVLWERWQDVPLLRFEDIVSRRHIMHCRVVPLGHGSSMQVRIDGADGAHATLSKSKLQAAAEFCIEARLYQWHGVDFSEDMATLWPDASPRARVERPWAPGFLPQPLGRDHRGDTSASPDSMLRWLKDLGPIHLRTGTSVARELATTAAGEPTLRPSLKNLFTRGAPMDSETRRLCREHLGPEPIEAYHRAEAGLIALQCPVSCAHHIQSEVCLVEVVDQNGRPCQPGEVGEVAITTLHNFVMPLIRYATGDLARNLQGLDGRPGPCACGRTLPLIERVPAAEKRANRAPAV